MALFSMSKIIPKGCGGVNYIIALICLGVLILLFCAAFYQSPYSVPKPYMEEYFHAYRNDVFLSLSKTSLYLINPRIPTNIRPALTSSMSTDFSSAPRSTKEKHSRAGLLEGTTGGSG